MPDQQIVLITGATGQQGGSILRELAGKGFTLRAMTRHPTGDAARKLDALGAQIVEGDLDDDASLRKCLKDTWGAFAVQNTWEAGVEKEEEQGKRFARLAREAGVQHFVYSSVASAHRRTGIPHFENKWRVEETVRGLEFPSHVILRPVFFMENLTSPWFLNDGKLMTALKPDTVLQMVAVKDIGRIGAHAFTHAAEMKGQEVDFAGDAATMPQTAAALSEGMGKKIPFVPIPIEEIRKNSDDFALMLEWFDRVGYDADIPAIEKRFGKMTSLAEWVSETVKS